MKTTVTEQLILGILAEQPRHGYDIEKLITERGTRKWADIGFSSIYYVLDKLEAKELVVSNPSQGKDKKQYSITDKGILGLKDAAKDLIAQRKPANTHFMVGLAVSDLLTADELIASLQRRKIELTASLENLNVRRSEQSQDMHIPLSAQRLFSLSKTLIEAELAWVNEELERVEG